MLQQLIKHVIAPLWAIKDGNNYFKYLEKLEETQFYDREKIDEIQFYMLKQIVSYAFANCPFYTKQYQKHSFHPGQLKEPSDIEKIPFIGKREIQKHKDEFVSKEYNVDSLIPDMTGGSTGSPLHYFYDMNVWGIRKAITIRHDRWMGWDIGDRVAYLWAAHRDTKGIRSIKATLRNLLLERAHVLNTADIGKEDLRVFTKILKRRKIQYLIAYASSIYLYAKYIRGTRQTDIRPKAILSSAEVLRDDQKAFIEDTFKCKVFNRYGCRELHLIASECDRHEGMHLNTDCIYMELLPRRSDENFGELVLTDLTNYAFPFIRYKIKDIGSWCDHDCSCGRGMRLLGSIEGRVADFILTPKGRLVSGPSVTITVIAQTPGLLQAQIIQDRIDHLIFKAVIDEAFEKEGKDFVIAKFRDFFGRDMKVDFEIADTIESEASGKYRFSISHVVDEHLMNGFH